MSEPLPAPLTDLIQEPEPSNLPLVSPSLVQPGDGRTSTAYEMKFLVSAETAELIQVWATEHLSLDPHANQNGESGYEITTIYLDTPQLHVFHRGAGHRRRKYRVRCYGGGSVTFIECKERHGDETAKQRCRIDLAEVTRLASQGADNCWAAESFRSEIERHALHPTCRMSYRRSAWMSHSATGPIRLTLDRQIRGVMTRDWNLAPVTDGHEILGDQVVCELKFRETMPSLFKSLMEQMQLNGSSVSKYRRWMAENLGIAPGSVTLEHPATGSTSPGVPHA